MCYITAIQLNLEGNTAAKEEARQHSKTITSQYTGMLAGISNMTYTGHRTHSSVSFQTLLFAILTMLELAIPSSPAESGDFQGQKTEGWAFVSRLRFGLGLGGRRVDLNQF